MRTINATRVFRVVVVGLLILTAVTAMGRGTPEDAWQDVEGTENWRHEIDISEYDEGTYNIILRGTDFAGNEYVEGPYNIRIDPESDKPVSRIIYPEAGEVVRGAVDIVGIAVDDDAVEYVEVRIDEGSWERAQGREYWRHQVATERLDDGPHLIEVRAVDINGLEGDSYAAEFLLDTEPPAISVTSHSSGSIVNGRVRFEGRVQDANGIEQLELSRDDRETFESVRVRNVRGEEYNEFRFDVRTDRLDDGPVIYWLKATDTTGASTVEPFLFFIDNESPDITVYSPQADDPVFGIINITGAIQDEVGVERFWYEWDDQEIEIPLIPGNPYWNVEIDTRGHRGRRVDVNFYAEDSSGNRSHVRHRMENDQDAALPVVHIQSPNLTGEDPVDSVASDAVLYGYVEGAHRASHIVVQGLQDEPIELPAYPAFAVSLADAEPGRQDIRISAVDELGYVGDEVRLRFTRQADAPDVDLTRLVYDSGQEARFVPAMEYDTLQSAELYGSVLSRASIDDVVVTIGSGNQAVTPRVRTSRGSQPDTTEFRFELPRDLGYGPMPIAVQVTDEYGAESVQRGQVYFRDLRRIESEPAIWIDDERMAGDGTVYLNGENPLQARLIGLHGGGESFANVRLDPAPDFLQLQHADDLAVVSAVDEGVAENVYLRAETAEGIALESGPYTFAVNRTYPDIEIEQPEGPDAVGGALRVSGTITDDAAIVRAEISFDGGESFESLGVSGAQNSFSAVHNLGDSDRSGSAVVVRAWDVHGNFSEQRRIVNHAAQLPLPGGAEAEGRRNDRPDVRVLFPQDRGVLQGNVQIGGIVTDLDGTRHIEVSVNGGEYRRVASFDERLHHQPFLIDMPNLGPGEHDIRVRAVDRHAEPETSRDQRVRFTAVGSGMEIRLESVDDSPAANGFAVPLGERTELQGVVANIQDIDSLRWRIGDGDWNRERTSDSEQQHTQEFSLTLPNDLTYGMHVLEIEASDSYGNSVRRMVGFSAQAVGQAPQHSNTVVFADDRVGIDSFVVHDSEVITGLFLGRPIAEAELIGGNDLFDVSVQGRRIQLLPVGQGTADSVVIAVTTVDGLEYTTAARTATVDSLAPELVIESIDDGYFAADGIPLGGSLTDEVGLDGLYYRIGTEGDFREIELGTGLLPEAADVDADTDADTDADAEEAIEPTTSPGAFAYTAELDGQQPGPLHVFVQGRDLTGRVVERWIPVVYDPDEPEIRFLTPPLQDVINGLTSVIAAVDSLSPVLQLEYTLDGEQYQSLPAGNRIDEVIDFSELYMAESEVVFRAVDAAGNQSLVSPDVQVSLEDDLPVVELQIPEDNAVITSDFTISGMAFDDDEVAEIHWRIGDDEFQQIPGDNSFAVDIALEDMTDNEHTIEVYAVDYYGLQGETVTSTIRVSLQEPDIHLDEPSVEETNRGIVRLSGRAEDENGIAEVWLSFDNSSTFHRARGTDEWEYDLNTAVFEDGTYSVQVVAVDEYGVPANYFTLINIDNTPPTLDISSPADNDVVAQEIQLNGRVDDSIGVVAFVLEIEPINESSETIIVDLPTDTILQEAVAIDELEEGWYNLRLTASDAADNQTVVARNVYVQDDIESAQVSLLFPQDGADRHGQVIVEGVASAPVPVRRVQLYLNDVFLDGIEVTDRGYFQYDIDNSELVEGQNEIYAVIEPASGDRVQSDSVRFMYESLGPYIAITSHQVGDFVSDRPWIRGLAGYAHDLDEDDRDNRQALRQLRVDYVEVSLDNGRTYAEARGGEEWRYRIETEDVPNGPLSVLVRAVFENGESAVTRTMFTVDKNPPDISMLNPFEDARLNTTLRIAGTAEDEHGIENIQAALRPGDKAGYAVPGFVQGMYFDANFLGLTYFKVGLGLSFFDDNVKLQGHYGISPTTAISGESARFAGTYMGGKLLANVLTLPFNLFLGPDWEFMSVNMALGASFDYIQLYDPIVPLGSSPDDATEGLVLGAILANIEIPRVEIESLSAFNAYTLYAEPQLWFIPSDASPDIKFRIAIGTRIQLF